MTCSVCGHPIVEHSSEPGVGCLHEFTFTVLGDQCPCTEPGTSQADQ